MDEVVEKRQAEFDAKQLKLLADLQQTSRQKEHEHEERMMAMMSMMQQTMALFVGQPPEPMSPSAGRMPPGPFFLIQCTSPHPTTRHLIQTHNSDLLN